ncbi:MAG: hypothetical protein ABSA12_14140 [Verrucomicrobiia bacterium]
MKRFTVTLTAVFELPDAFEITKDPRDGFVTLKRGGEYYHPTFEWMERHLEIEPVNRESYESSPGVSWESVNDETANEFFEASLAKGREATEQYQIEQL